MICSTSIRKTRNTTIDEKHFFFQKTSPIKPFLPQVTNRKRKVTNFNKTFSVSFFLENYWTQSNIHGKANFPPEHSITRRRRRRRRGNRFARHEDEPPDGDPLRARAAVANRAGSTGWAWEWAGFRRRATTGVRAWTSPCWWPPKCWWSAGTTSGARRNGGIRCAVPVSRDRAGSPATRSPPLRTGWGTSTPDGRRPSKTGSGSSCGRQTDDVL